jgi:antitoxin (DNA-binding transcriptional repressor) of toxin-antitoxin stability system
MVSRISVSEVAGHLNDLIGRVRAGEEFVVEQAGEDVLRIGPVKPRQMLGSDLIELLKRLPKPDDEFFDEVERAINNQGELPPDRWE